MSDYAQLDAPQFHKSATTAWATQVGDNFEHLWTERPSVSLTRTSSTTCLNGIGNTVTWTDADWDTGDFWTSGDTLTVPRSGFYLLTLSVEWEPNTDYRRLVVILKNTYEGILLGAEKPDDTTGYCAVNASGVAYLSEGDSLTALMYQSSGVTLDATHQRIQALWVGAYDAL